MDNGEIPPGKRKKAVAKCPNPLFLFWVKELRDDAAARGLKTQYTYGKAMRSLQKYPLPLPTGKACKILEHVGDKICQILDQKLAEHIDLYGTADFVPDEIAEALPGYRKPPQKRAPATAAAYGSGSDNENVGVNNTGKKQRKKSGGGREYLPQPGSGPYAMLITLLRIAGETGYMLKGDLMKEAQPLSDTSFLVPDPGTRYTAWSSMGTLVRHGLVIKRSSPAKYNLTPAGVQLAQRLLALDAAGRGRDDRADGPDQGAGVNFVLGGVHVPLRPHLPQLPRVPQVMPPQDDPPAWPTLPNGATAGTDNDPFRHRIHTLSSGSDVDMLSPAKTPSTKFPGRGHSLGASAEKRANPVPWRVKERCPSPPPYDLPDVYMPLPDPEPPQPVSGMQFAYCTEEGTDVRQKDKAAVTIEEILGGLGFLIVCPYDELLMSDKLYNLDNTRSATGGKVYAFLADKDAPETSPLPLPQTTIPKREPTATVTRPTPPIPTTIPKPTKTAKPKPKSETVTTKTQESKPPILSNNLPGAWGLPVAGPSTSGYGGPRPGPSTGQRRSPWDAGSSAGSSVAGSRESSQDVDYDKASIDEEPAFTLNPGTFDVILCVDKREHFGGAKSSKQLLLPELQKHQTKFELRNLQIGDFAWVARPKNSPEGDREVVLDHIVERKRMDDLASSIVDGRFREQKIPSTGSMLQSDYSELESNENSENIDPNICDEQSDESTKATQNLTPGTENNSENEMETKETHQHEGQANARKFRFAKLQTSITDWAKSDKWMDKNLETSDSSRNVDNYENMSLNGADPRPATSSTFSDETKVKPCKGTLDSFVLKNREPSGDNQSHRSVEKCQSNSKPHKNQNSRAKQPHISSHDKENCMDKSIGPEPFSKALPTANEMQKEPVEIDRKMEQLNIGDQGLDRTAESAPKSLKVSTSEKTKAVTRDVTSEQSAAETFKPLVAPTVERLPMGAYELVFFDLETTGLGMHSHIVQLAAAGPFGTFNRYIKPKVSINREASAVTGIRFFKGRLFYKGRPVFAAPIRQCLEQFLRSLPREPTLLVGHNAHQYDARLLLRAARNCNMEDAFAKKICGFLDTLPLFRAERPDNKSNSQEALVKQYLGDSYNAHNAKADSSALRKLLRHCDFTREQLIAHTVSTSYVLRLLDYEEKKRSNYESLKMLVEGCALSEGMAEKAARVGLRYEYFTAAHKKGGAEAVHDLLSAPNADGKPRVTKSAKILKTVSDFLKELAEYN